MFPTVGAASANKFSAARRVRADKPITTRIRGENIEMRAQDTSSGHNDVDLRRLQHRNVLAGDTAIGDDDVNFLQLADHVA